MGRSWSCVVFFDITAFSGSPRVVRWLEKLGRAHNPAVSLGFRRAFTSLRRPQGLTLGLARAGDHGLRSEP